MEDKPIIAPCGATYLAKTPKGEWVWLFEEEVDPSSYDQMERVTGSPE